MYGLSKPTSDDNRYLTDFIVGESTSLSKCVGVCDNGCAAMTGKNGRNSCKRLSSGSNFNSLP